MLPGLPSFNDNVQQFPLLGAFFFRLARFSIRNVKHLFNVFVVTHGRWIQLTGVMERLELLFAWLSEWFADVSGSSCESSFLAKIMFSHTCLIVASLTVEIKILFAQFSPTISMNFRCESVKLHSDNDDDQQLFRSVSRWEFEDFWLYSMKVVEEEDEKIPIDQRDGKRSAIIQSKRASTANPLITIICRGFRWAQFPTRVILFHCEDDN